MKKLMLALAIVTIGAMFSSCKKEINGSGHFVTQTRSASPFDEVSSSGDFTVTLVEDSVYRIEMYGEDNILPEIETVVSGNQLRIYFENYNGHYDHNGVNVTVYSPHFKKIDLQGSGKIYSFNTLNSESMDVNISGSGKIDLAVNNATLNSNISGSGSITLAGTNHTASHRISGSGNLYAFDLESSEVNATISGSGKCRVYALDILDATISGSGDVIYRGQPQITKHISGSGQVRPE